MRSALRQIFVTGSQKASFSFCVRFSQDEKIQIAVKTCFSSPERSGCISTSLVLRQFLCILQVFAKLLHPVFSLGSAVKKLSHERPPTRRCWQKCQLVRLHHQGHGEYVGNVWIAARDGSLNGQLHKPVSQPLRQALF